MTKKRVNVVFIFFLAPCVLLNSCGKSIGQKATFVWRLQFPKKKTEKKSWKKKLTKTSGQKKKFDFFQKSRC